MVGITAWESKVTRNDEPSGGLFATTAAPSAPAAPALFSTITMRPSLFWRLVCNSRASASVDPPGGNGTTSVIFDDCAAACVTASRAGAASKVRREIAMIPPFWRAFRWSAALGRPQAGARLSVFRPRWTEDVKYACTIGTCAHGMRHVARRSPEIALIHRDLGMMVQRAFRMR